MEQQSYKIDSIGMWLNFDMIATASPTSIPTGGSGAYHDNYGRDLNPTGKNGLFLFTRFLLQLRKAHPACGRHALRSGFGWGRRRYLLVKNENGVSDATRCPCLHWRINEARSAMTTFFSCEHVAGGVLFAVPKRIRAAAGRIIDTAPWAEAIGQLLGSGHADTVESNYWVNPHSVVVLLEVG